MKPRMLNRGEVNQRPIAGLLLLHGLLPGVQAQEPLLISGGAIIDVRTGRERPRPAILIERGRIVAVGPVDGIHLPKGARRIDISGLAEARAGLIAAATSGDPSALACVYTSDAVLMNPNLPDVRGRAEIEAHFRRAFALIRIREMTLTPIEVAGNDRDVHC